jgi:hypothetical protein
MVTCDILRIQRWHRSNDQKYFWRDVMKNDLAEQKWKLDTKTRDMSETVDTLE